MNLLYCPRGGLCLRIVFLLTPFFIIFFRAESIAQQTFRIEGQVRATGAALPGANVQIKASGLGATTNEQGKFDLQVTADSARLVVSYIGYRSIDTLLLLPQTARLVLTMYPDASMLNELAVTGYQTIPKERATGSFIQVDNALINRSVSTNLLDRLVGNVSGLAFQGQPVNPTGSNPLSRNLGIRIRGESTLAASTMVSRDPLIVVDNFPFEGSLASINPNDVESMTILRDAAAASIWGARAGNGVIVIVTKKGNRSQPIKAELTANLGFVGKPDLFADANYLDAASYIDVERQLYSRGYFDTDIAGMANRPVISPAVSILAAERSGEITPESAQQQLATLSNSDVRRDFQRWVYQKQARQQYALSLSGGAARSTYRVSAGYDYNRHAVIGNGDNRITLTTENSVTPVTGLDLNFGLHYSDVTVREQNHQNQYGSIMPGGKYSDLYPYTQLADALGNPLEIVKDFDSGFKTRALDAGFQDWEYRPLQEAAIGSKKSKTTDLLIKSSLSYSLTKWLRVQAQYAFERQNISAQLLNTAESYYSRDLVNRFTIINPDSSLSYQVPLGGVLRLNEAVYVSHNGRLQFNLDKSVGFHGINLLAGAEVRQLKTTGFDRTSYGYDPLTGVSANNLDFSKALPTQPSGMALIPVPEGAMQGFMNRFISYYLNGSYSYKTRYVLSASARRDGANIFGARTNDKVTPLWSIGAAWELSEERFYAASWMPYLKIRGSYGSSGNVYQGSVYVTGTYVNSGLTGLPTINALLAPNPNLQWETVRTMNLAVDFASRSDRFSGSLEFYLKKGADLVQNLSLPPSAGFRAMYGNSAATTTRGFDFTLRTDNLRGKLRWQTTWLISHIADRVDRFDVSLTATSIQGQGEGRIGVKGKPLYAIYGYKWNGIDPNGDPLGNLNGEKSKEYAKIISNFQPDSLDYKGSGVPTWFGSIRNDFTLGPWSLSVNLTYKLGYVFRRTSIGLNYADVLAGKAHQDYNDRWQTPGDESATSVPALIYPSNAQRNTFYQYSSVLVEKGDHVRLQDIRVAFDLGSILKRLKAAQLYLYATNLGVVWRANQQGLDPDYVSLTSRHQLLPPSSISLGFRTSF
ncbi:TonB-linked outer membrane protein, SusC/RagA family [Dyadobacter sp. SG02]|uniref:SusC/RagA family TonB-linked outer membrane protein n=1 Tax=Dyadobacter sp. SG02 TaxID=1855291 RepID=UPI0008D01357|nr:SusC/RagA family TonB-linked outer membrane protein [Dyadobacter sp. SG02]SEJ52825.1 TonB-linked outer membrane protein, SusC/RagA family [Dyadobacter sp. SG02]